MAQVKRVKRLSGGRQFKHISGLYLSKGNKKLDNSIAIFNISAVKTCPNCSKCAPTCYAKKAETLYPYVEACRANNWELTKQADFVDNMIELIRESNASTVRIHESGDFYSQEYADKWSEIAEWLPNIKFYCYTKSPYRPNASNINIVESILPDGSVNYGKLDDMMEKASLFNAFVCPCKPGDREKLCGSKCTKCLTQKHVVFIQH